MPRQNPRRLRIGTTNFTATPDAASRQRGSVIVLVMVVLVLMVILGTAYIQVARLDRIASSLISTNNIDTVAAAQIQLIQQTLAEDLFDANGKFLPDDSTPNRAEPFDIAYTNSGVTHSVTLSDGTTTSTAKGGISDDTWLASTAPDFTTNPLIPRWPHITNLSGIYLRIPRGTASNANAVPSSSNTGEMVTDQSDLLHTDSTLSGANALFITGHATATNNMDDNSDAQWLPWGVDADGDGIPDSRYTWAAIRQISGTTYVTAVRIVDNSAMANANIWLSQVDNAGAFDTSPGGADAPHWNHPAELDLGRFIYSLDTPSAASNLAQMRDLLITGRGFTASQLPVGQFFVNGTDRNEFWTNAGRRLSNILTAPTPYKSLGLDDEAELRYRNGLNNDKIKSTIETAMGGGAAPYFLRHNVTETDYTAFRSGTAGAAHMKIYFEEEPRHQMTVRNGASMLAPRLPDFGAAVTHNNNSLANDADRVDKVDLNVANVATLSAEVRKVIERSTPVAFVLPASTVDNQTFANQLAANIVDYRDADNLLTEIDPNGIAGDGDEVYGFEMLPMITEVYAQRRFVAASSTPNGGTWDVTWNQMGAAGFAIEIRNPFAVAISLEHVHLVLNGTDLGVLSDGGTGGVARQATIAPGEIIVLFRNSTGGAPADDTIYSATDTIVDTGGTPNTNVDISTVTGANWPTAAGTVTVALHGEAVAGTMLAKPYDKVDSDPMLDTYTQTGATTDPMAPSPVEGYRVQSRIGNGTGLNMLATVGTGGTNAFVATSQLYPVVPQPGADLRSATPGTLDGLGKANKASGGTPGPGNLGTLATQQIIHNNGPLVQTGELAHMIIVGSDASATGTIPEKWAGQSSVETLMLNFDATEYVGAGNLAIPHAAFMLERFTTVSPLSDGIDNDNDGNTDDIQEQLVPGLININTVTRDFLKRVLMIPDDGATNTRDTLVDRIINYRDLAAPYNAANRGLGAGYRGNAGIASIGELTRFVNSELTTPAAYVGNTAAINGTKIDFTDDTIGDDREEKMLLAKYLAQVCTTRSDIFTAYVTIQGYPSGDFRLGPTESTTFLAVFDRSGVTSTTQAVKVLRVFKLN